MQRLLSHRDPVDAPVLAATVLLRWLSLCVLVCMIGTACFYLLAKMSGDVSVHRRDMNAAAYRAQLFFDHREALLNYLADSVVTSSASRSPAGAAADDDDEMQRLPLGHGRDGQQLSLLLSDRAERTLGDYGAQLVHVGEDPHTPRQWLHGARTPVTPPPAELTAGLLKARAKGSGASAKIHWLASTDTTNRIYLYRAVEDDPAPAHWLVLVLDQATIAEVVHTERPGRLVLLDGQGRRGFSNGGGADVPEAWLRSRPDDVFAFVWSRGVPRGLAFVKGVGEDGWRLVYNLPLRVLIGDLAMHIGVSLLLCLGAVAALRVLTRRIDRQLIQPARRQHRQLLESFDFGSTVIEMAPVGICVLGRHGGQVVLENQLARDWLGVDTSAGDWIGGWRKAAELGARRSGVQRSAELTTCDGRQLQVLFAETRYHDADVLLCVFSDISRHRQIQSALAAA